MARRKKPKKISTVPGMARLDEDVMRAGTVRMSLKGWKRVNRGPQATETGTYEPPEVEERLLRAMMTLRAVPDRERRFFAVKSGHPPHVQEAMDAYASVEAVAPRFRPTPFDVSDYLTALSWARCLDRMQWRVVWLRSFGLSFGVIGHSIGQSDETARRRYREAITDAWISANGKLAA